MKYGVYLFPPGGSGEAKHIVELAQSAERLRFDSAWMGDHIAWPVHFDPEPHRHGVGGKTPSEAVVNVGVFEPLTTLAFLAAKVERIRIGLGVLVPAYRNPIVCAKMLSMLDVLSNGRLTVGVGPGWLREEFAMLDAPAYEDRGAVTDEFVRVFIELWTKDRPHFEGRFAHASGLVFNPKPVQKPHPPIWVGGNGLPAMRRAAAYGQGWMPLHQSPAAMAEKVRQMREMAQAGGRNPSDIGVAVGCRFRFSDGDASMPDADSLTGTEAQIVDQLRRYREAGVDEVYLLNDGYGNVADLVGAWERFTHDVVGAV